MVSHDHKCIFIHIPKCAGTSVETILGHLDNHEGRGGQDHRSIRMIENPYLTPKILCSMENVTEFLRRQKHQYLSTVKNPKNKNTVTRCQYSSYFKFSIVRNPWARIFSAYRNIMRDEVHRKDYGIVSDIDFKDFLKTCVGVGMLRSQMYWLKDFRGLIPIDYIAKFESLETDMREIFERLGLDDTNLPHKLEGEKIDYREYYDDEARRFVYENYREEIEEFGYSFD